MSQQTFAPKRIAGGEIRPGKNLLDLERWIGLVWRIEIRVAVHVTATAGRHLEDVHVQSELDIPGEQTVIVVDLGARRAIIFRDKGAARAWISENNREKISTHRIYARN